MKHEADEASKIQVSTRGCCCDFRRYEARTSPLAVPHVHLVKTEAFAEQYGDTSFRASQGWLEKFKLRHGVICKSVLGEAAAVDPPVAGTWRTNNNDAP